MSCPDPDVCAWCPKPTVIRLSPELKEDGLGVPRIKAVMCVTQHARKLAG
jgi:hypothetical protein